MNVAAESDVVLLRGDRYCTSCKDDTPHVADPCMSPVGRRLLWFLPLVIITPVVNAIFGTLPTRPTVLAAYWVLPILIVLVLVGMARTRRAFRVRCQRCNSESLRLTPPRWSGHSNLRERTS